MSTRGRKRNHPKLQELSGAYKKDPQRRPKANAAEGVESPPEPSDVILSKKSLIKVWQDTCRILDEMGILSSSDAHLLESYCLVYHEMLVTAKTCLEHGHVQAGKSVESQSANSTVWLKLVREHRSLMAELGLTPTARTKITVPDKKSGVSEVDELLGELGV